MLLEVVQTDMFSTSSLNFFEATLEHFLMRALQILAVPFYGVEANGYGQLQQ